VLSLFNYRTRLAEHLVRHGYFSNS
jgi:hypothetical protein